MCTSTFFGSGSAKSTYQTFPPDKNPEQQDNFVMYVG